MQNKVHLSVEERLSIIKSMSATLQNLFLQISLLLLKYLIAEKFGRLQRVPQAFGPVLFSACLPVTSSSQGQSKQ